MKNILFYSLFLLMAGMAGCKKGNYPGGTVSPYISLFDVRNLHKGDDVTLTSENMFGANQIAVVVVSDHAGNNLPPDLLVVQDRRRLGQLRGIAIPLTPAAASSYVPGDSLLINVEGGVLKKVKNPKLVLQWITHLVC